MNNKTITKITYKGQELSIYIPQLNIDKSTWFSNKSAYSNFIDSTGFYTKLRAACFVPQPSMQNIYLPNCKEIEPYIFDGCSRLTDLTIPSPKDIPDLAFFNTSKIAEKVNLNKVSMVGENGFGYLRMSSLELPECISIGTKGFRNSNLQTISLPKCEILGDFAFSGCGDLTTIDMPNLKTIGNQAFYDCQKLTNINLSNCEIIGSYVFRNCYNLSEVYIGKATSIGYEAFLNCSNLQKVTLLGNAGISAGTFSSCPSLKEIISNGSYFSERNLSTVEKVYLPKISTAASSLFLRFSNLKDVSLDNLTTISGSVAFESCHNLPKIVLPKLSSIAASCFRFCSSLSQIILPYHSVVTLGANCFGGSPILNSTYLGYYGSIYVPSALIPLYKVATNWTSISNRIAAIEDLPVQ